MNEFVNNTEKQTFKDGMTICPICGKNICIMNKSKYSYKFVNKHGYVRYFCSWKCFNEGCTQISNYKRLIKNPCYDVKTKTDCSKRCAGCSISCNAWKNYKERMESQYDARRYENDYWGHMEDRKNRISNYKGPKRKIEH